MRRSVDDYSLTFGKSGDDIVHHPTQAAGPLRIASDCALAEMAFISQSATRRRLHAKSDPVVVPPSTPYSHALAWATIAVTTAARERRRPSPQAEPARQAIARLRVETVITILGFTTPRCQYARLASRFRGAPILNGCICRLPTSALTILPPGHLNEAAVSCTPQL